LRRYTLETLDTLNFEEELKMIDICAVGQGLTPVHVSAQRKRFPWDRGCI